MPLGNNVTFVLNEIYFLFFEIDSRYILLENRIFWLSYFFTMGLW
jgi:hypothetical protein